MINMLSSVLIVLSMTFFTACGNEIQPPQVENNTTTTSIPSRIQDESEDTEGSGESVMNEQFKVINLTVADESFIVNLADNSSSEALKELLDKGELTINMSDYGGFEKVGSLGESLPPMMSKLLRNWVM